MTNSEGMMARGGMQRRDVLTAAAMGASLGLVARPADAAPAAPMEGAGTTAPGYEAVKSALARAMAGDPGGAQLCVYRHGVRVVDLWCGQDPVNKRPFDADTIGIVMSASKGVTATCAHILVQRGLLDLDAPVARYWPEFARNGKQDLPVRYLLSHEAGLAAFPPEAHIGAMQMLDWNTMVTALADLKPMWKPGSAFAYHTVNFGWLVGEVVRRITGRTLGEVVAAEITGRLKTDLWLGLPEGEEHRVAPQFLLGAGPAEAAQNAALNSRAGHVAEIPAGNVITNARGLARMYAALIGDVDGIRLLDRASVERLRTPQTDGLPYFSPLAPAGGFRFPLRFGLGYELYRTGVPFIAEGSFGHTGAGGRLGWAHPESGTAIGFNVNSMTWRSDEGPDPRWTPWFEELRRIVAA